jgi:hypothetical protein
MCRSVTVTLIVRMLEISRAVSGPRAKVRRAPFGPGLWPGPRRQARWAGRGLQGQRRAAGASRASGMRSTVEAGGASPNNARHRSGSGRCDIFTAPGTWCEGDGLTVVLAGAGSGVRRGPQAAGHRGRRARQLAAPQGLRPKDAAKAAAPQRRDPG